MAWDIDATVFFLINDSGGPFMTDGTSEAENMNDEEGVVKALRPPNGGVGYGVWQFPELREFDGMFLCALTSSNGEYTEISSSGASTNGLSGGWNVETSSPVWGDNTPVKYRDVAFLKTFATSNVKALRYKGQHSSVGPDRFRRSMHIYGPISPGATPDRLTFLDPVTADSIWVKPIDWGDVPQSQSSDVSIKIKNNSGGLTASTNELTSEDIYLGSGAWYTFSDDGITFNSTFSLGNLGPGATKTLTVRQNVPGAAAVGPHAARLRVSTVSWA
jgi:hypothetical protein